MVKHRLRVRHVVEIPELYSGRVRRVALSRCRELRRLLYRAVSRARAHRGFLASGQGRPDARIRARRLGVHGGSGPLDARTVAQGRGGLRARRPGASGSTAGRRAGAAEIAPQGIVSQSHARRIATPEDGLDENATERQKSRMAEYGILQGECRRFDPVSTHQTLPPPSSNAPEVREGV